MTMFLNLPFSHGLGLLGFRVLGYLSVGSYSKVVYIIFRRTLAKCSVEAWAVQENVMFRMPNPKDFQTHDPQNNNNNNNHNHLTVF